MQFYLGTHMPNWLWSVRPARWPWFVSRPRLARQRSYQPATVDWALDSGGFTEIKDHGRWRIDARTYAAEVRRYRDEIGRMRWAAPQDWMCEPTMLKKTGLTVAEHQRRTVDNFLELRHVAADLPIVPALQGWAASDYLRHVEQYDRAGVDLTAEPLVGVGSVCRRARLAPMASLFAQLHADGMRLHGFGLKSDGLSRYGWVLDSADSMAWSYAARQERAKSPLCGGFHAAKACNNCRDWAEIWAERATADMVGGPVQMELL